jgi:hypothetical protein
MPITIITPAQDAPFGFGHQFNIITDLSHNDVGDGHWEISVLSGPTFEFPVRTWVYPFTGSSVVQPLGRETDQRWNIPIPVEGLIQGLVGKIRVELFDQIGTSVQQQIQSFVNEHQSGMPVIATTTTTQVQGGFDAADREDLQAILSSVAGELLSSETSGAKIVSNLWQLLQCPPETAVCRTSGFPVNGDVTLTRPGVLGPVSAYGVSLDFSILPDRLGVTPGAVDLAQERLIQIALIRKDVCGNEYISQLNEVHQRHADIRWCDPQSILRVEVSVLPGVTAGWSWLGLLGA